jgi:hypothetical protein
MHDHMRDGGKKPASQRPADFRSAPTKMMTK